MDPEVFIVMLDRLAREGSRTLRIESGREPKRPERGVQQGKPEGGCFPTDEIKARAEPRNKLGMDLLDGESVRARKANGPGSSHDLREHAGQVGDSQRRPRLRI